MKTEVKHNINSTDLMSDIKNAIDKASRIIVVSHINPDGDALGTQLAVTDYLESIGKTVVMVRDSVIPERYSFLDGIENIVHAESVADPKSYDTMLILECPTRERFGTANRFVHEGVTLINIDHHQDSTSFGDHNWIDGQASSVGEMLYDFFKFVSWPISRRVANLLYVAIMTDTGRFRFESCHAHTFAAAADLVEAGADPRSNCDNTYFAASAASMKLLGKVLNQIEFYDDNSLCLLTLTRNQLAETGAKASDTEGLVDYTLYSGEVLVGALLNEVDSKTTKVSLRARNGVNVADIAAHFGGGGHIKAAGCTINKSLDDARTELLSLIREAMKNE